MRIGLPGSTSFGGGLSNLSQSGHPRSRSGTGSWSGGDRAAASAAGWPRGFARGVGGGGVAGVSGGHTPPLATTSTSWTKLSAATLAAQRFSAIVNQEQFGSPASAAQQQPSAAEVFSVAGAGYSALADDAPGSGAPKQGRGQQEEEEEEEQAEGEEKETYSPFSLRRAYQGADGGGRPIAERRWEDGEVPFREKGEAEGGERGGGVVAPEGGKRALHAAITGTRESVLPRRGSPVAAALGVVQPAPAAAQPRLEAALAPASFGGIGVEESVP